MAIRTLSCCFTVADVATVRDFFVRHFAARVTFDCGWYVNLEFGDPCASLQLMAPRENKAPARDLTGVTVNLMVEEVDREHARLGAAGLPEVMPLADHAWGDRGFAVAGPDGLVVYLFSPREPDAQYLEFYR